MLLVLVAFLAACAPRSGGRVEKEALTPITGQGWAMAVPEGARVEASERRVDVDALDGSRWFTVALADPEITPEAFVWKWANDTCTRVRWDETSQPTPTTVFTGGSCMIEHRDYWVMSAIETRPDGTLITLYAADTSRLTFEDTWVDALGTAFSLSTGDQPASHVPTSEIRDRVRQIAAGDRGHLPVPGGGNLSARVSDAFAPMWQRRASAEVPTTLRR